MATIKCMEYSMFTVIVIIYCVMSLEFVVHVIDCTCTHNAIQQAYNLVFALVQYSLVVMK